MEVLNQLERCLRGNKTYDGMIERKNRCLRITYANDFHMDIMVGCQESYYEKNRIIVPDRKTKDWVDSNPIGFGDWFKIKSELAPEQYDLLLKAHNSRNMEIRLSENLPIEPAYELKLPLERAVQILKRKRDVYFNGKEDRATASIILTTLAAEAYRGELSVFETIDRILTSIEQKPRNIFGWTKPFEVLNPANPKENFSDKWFDDETLFTDFLDFVADTRRIWNSLKSANNPLLRDSLLEEAFGDSRIKRLVAEQRNYKDKIEKVRRLTPLAQAAGLGTLSTTNKVKSTFESGVVQNKPARRYGGKAFPVKANQTSGGTNYLQKRWIEDTYPGIFKTEIKYGVLICCGKIKPSGDCGEYWVKIKYVPGSSPQVYIDNYKIEPRTPIHMYSDGSLCLFYLDFLGL